MQFVAPQDGKSTSITCWTMCWCYWQNFGFWKTSWVKQTQYLNSLIEGVCPYIWEVSLRRCVFLRMSQHKPSSIPRLLLGKNIKLPTALLSTLWTSSVDTQLHIAIQSADSVSLCFIRSSSQNCQAIHQSGSHYRFRCSRANEASSRVYVSWGDKVLVAKLSVMMFCGLQINIWWCEWR